MNSVLRPQRAHRPMTVRDIDSVLAIEASAYTFPWSRGNFVDSLAAGYQAEVIECSPAAGPVGYFIAMAGVDELHLLNLTVAPAWQGLGHGHALLDAVQAFGRTRGLGALWLEVRESNHRARSLYRRRGFAEVGLRRGYYPAAGPREDAVVMRLTLVGADADADGAPHGVD
jgi:ribosomal-protein-alanine N-acetyltransferase